MREMHEDPDGGRTIDPDRFSPSNSPALIEVVTDDDSQFVSVADVSIRDDGSLYCRGWQGRRFYVGAAFWYEVALLGTETYNPDDESDDYDRARICDHDRQYLPAEVRP